VTFEVTLQPASGEGDGTVAVFSGSALEQKGESQDVKLPGESAKKSDYGAYEGMGHQAAFLEDATGTGGGAEGRHFALDAINRLCLWKLKKSK
jgi:hypothetical protein